MALDESAADVQQCPACSEVGGGVPAAEEHDEHDDVVEAAAMVRHSRGGTSATGMGLRRTTASAVLPRSRRGTPERAWVLMTMRPARSASAASTMASAAGPVRTTGLALSPRAVSSPAMPRAKAWADAS